MSHNFCNLLQFSFFAKGWFRTIKDKRARSHATGIKHVLHDTDSYFSSCANKSL